MSTQLRRNQRRIGIGAISLGTVVIGGYLIVKTFPHLKNSICRYFSCSSDKEEDNEPIEIDDEAHNEGIEEPSDSVKEFEAGSYDETIDVSSWSEDNLKSFLREVSLLFSFFLLYQMYSINRFY